MLIFLLGGSGLSFDIAQCCDEFAGIGLSLNAHKHEEDKECCACFKFMKKKACCDDVVVQTVINSVLGLEKPSKLIAEKFSFKIFQHAVQVRVSEPRAIQIASTDDNYHYHDPVPVLIKKRVLQI